jgi:ABC-type uncharacterized transport system substrate-binding protein
LSNTGMVLRAREAQEAAAKLGVSIKSNGVHNLVDFAPAFTAIEGGRSNALLTLVDPFTSQHRKLIVDFAARRRLPAIYEAREFVESGGLIRDHVVAGGLVSYGVDLRWCFRRAAYFVDKILRGAAPGDLPVEFPTKMVLAVNLRTASALDITVPPTLLTRADEVME